jgi:mRNA interferase MazF
MEITDIKRGDIYFANLGAESIGSEQRGVRPVLIIQNNAGNTHAPTVIVAAITAQTKKAKLPTHVKLPAKTTDMKKDSIAMLEQIRTIDKSRIISKIGQLDDDLLERINVALEVSLSL